MTTTPLEQPVRAAHKEAREYTGGVRRPLRGYLGLLGAYGALVTGMGAVVARRGVPERIETSDLALMSVATHKVARLIAKDPVTSPLRAPFARFSGPSGTPAEVSEDVRGDGGRHAVGELVTCPFCLGQWVATGFAFGFAVAPRPTRIVASVFTALTVSDFLQLAYAAASRAA